MGSCGGQRRLGRGAVDCGAIGAPSRRAGWLGSTSLSTQAALAGLALVALSGAAEAASITWGGITGNWSKNTNWTGSVVPGAGDAVSIGAGVVNVNDARSATSVAISAGTLDINSGGTLGISNLFDITGGTVRGSGTITVGVSGSVTQSGGIVNTSVSAPSYTISGGRLNSSAAISGFSSFGLSGTAVVVSGATVTGASAATSTATLAGAVGDATMNGTIQDIATLTQSGASMGGTVKTATYTMTGGRIAAAGIVDFSTKFEQSGGTVVAGAQLNGDGDATMSLSGAVADVTMNGTVKDIASFTQSGAAMGGTVSTGTYTMTDGRINAAGTVNFTTKFEQSGGTVVAEAKLNGDGDATMSLSGAVADVTMNGTVKDIASFAQSGGAMGGTVSTGTYTMTDGRINAAGTVNFTTKFEQSGGTVVAGAQLIGDPTATMSLSGAIADVTMNGTVTGKGAAGTAIASFAQSGASMGGSVTTETYTMTGGRIDAAGIVNFSTKFEQSGGSVVAGATLTGDPTATMSLSGAIADVTMNGTVTGISSFAQSGASMGGVVTTGTYTMTGGRINGAGEVTFSTKFEQSGGTVGASAKLHGGTGATMSLSGDETVLMNGTVDDGADGGITSFAQSGGDMGGTVTTGTYTLSGGKLTGTANNYTLFAMTGGRVAAGAKVVGAAGAVMTISGDETVIMNGTVSGMDTVTQSGGDVGGSVTTTQKYTLSGGKITNGAVISFGPLFEQTGGVVTAGALLNGGGSGSSVTLAGDSTVKMNGSAIGLDAFTQSGGTLGGSVVTAVYNLTSADAAFTSDGSIEASSAFGLSAASGTVDVSAKLTGAGNLEKTGASVIKLSNAANDYTGTTTVTAGTLSLAGTLTGDVTVKSGATLGGTATLGKTTIESGGILAPGNSIGTTTVATLTLNSGSYYDVEVNDAGGSDKTVVTGLATLAGTVRVLPESGTYAPTTNYTILTAGSISGSFSGVTSSYVFLLPQLSQDSQNVYLKLVRNDVGFSTVGETPNQRAAAAAAEALGPTNPLYTALLFLSQDDAPGAFGALSGEGHASFASAFLQHAGQFADMFLARFDHAFGGAPQTTLILTSADAALPGDLPGRRHGLWGQLYGAQGSMAGDDTARIESRMGGFAGGIDGRLGDWLIGAAFHAGGTSGTVDALATEAKSTDYGAGLYAGTQWGATRLSFGALFTHHEIRTTRTVAFPGVDEVLTADYGANTAQAFARLSHGFDLRGVSITPFADAAYVRHTTGAFTETGGDAALSSAADTIDAAFTTLGFGIGKRFMAGETPVALRGSLGWRHAFAGAPEASYAFVGGTSFTVVGAPIASDLLVASAGLSIDFAGDARFGIAYDGQIGTDAQAHALKATWSLRF